MSLIIILVSKLSNPPCRHLFLFPLGFLDVSLVYRLVVLSRFSLVLSSNMTIPQSALIVPSLKPNKNSVRNPSFLSSLYPSLEIFFMIEIGRWFCGIPWFFLLRNQTRTSQAFLSLLLLFFFMSFEFWILSTFFCFFWSDSKPEYPMFFELRILFKFEIYLWFWDTSFFAHQEKCMLFFLCSLSADFLYGVSCLESLLRKSSLWFFYHLLFLLFGFELWVFFGTLKYEFFRVLFSLLWN